MKFQAFKTESIHNRRASDQLYKIPARDYVLHREPRETGSPYEITARITVTVYGDNLPSIRVWLISSVTGTVQDLGELTALQLRRIAQIREDIDRWIAGDLDELPRVMPWEAQLWKP